MSLRPGAQLGSQISERLDVSRPRPLVLLLPVLPLHVVKPAPAGVEVELGEVLAERLHVLWAAVVSGRLHAVQHADGPLGRFDLTEMNGRISVGLDRVVARVQRGRTAVAEGAGIAHGPGWH